MWPIPITVAFRYFSMSATVRQRTGDRGQGTGDRKNREKFDRIDKIFNYLG